MSEAVEGAAGAPVSESDASVIRSSTVMATGTIISRVTGVLRTTALTAAVGTGLLADAYNTANTLPNIIYILLIGGALNAVFIPQLVRHMKDDADERPGVLRPAAHAVAGWCCSASRCSPC